MSQVLTTFVPIFAFMLIPVWIPLVTAFVGAVADRFVSVKSSPAEAAVAAAKARSALAHAATAAPAEPAAATSARTGRHVLVRRASAA